MNRSLRTFFAVLAVLFGIPWAVMIAWPWLGLSALDRVPYDASDSAPDSTYPPARRGVLLGSQVYARSGCCYCHTQMVRPTYAGADMWRPGWGGREDPKLARETQPRDYLGEDYAYLGLARIGPDLSNVGNRINDVSWHYRHLLDPRKENPGSVMPSYRDLFERRRVTGPGSGDAIAVEEQAGSRYEIVPSNEAKALVLYLLSMKKDHKLPGKLASTK